MIVEWERRKSHAKCIRRIRFKKVKKKARKKIDVRSQWRTTKEGWESDPRGKGLRTRRLERHFGEGQDL